MTVAGSRTLHDAARHAFETHWVTATPPPEGWAAAPESRPPPVGPPMPQVAPLERRVASRRLALIAGSAVVDPVVRALVTKARRRLLATVPYAHAGAAPVRDVLELMQEANARGVECGLLLGVPPAPQDAERLRRLSFEVRRMDPARSTSGHAKGVVADAVALISSANWSAAGLRGNWEVALRVADRRAAGYFAEAWRRDWETGLGIEV